MNQKDDDELFVYSPEQRKAILSAIGLPEGEVADKLILACEYIADNTLTNWDYFMQFPKDKEMRNILNRIAWHMEQIIEIADFGGNERLRNSFWANMLLNKNAVLPKQRWKIFIKMFNSISFSVKFLRLIANKEKTSMWFGGKDNSIDIERELNGNVHLKQLASAYYLILGKRPGRSKSTIGPFIRFAHEAMVSLSKELTPSIETLNERWARLDFDPQGKNLNAQYIREYCEKRGINNPF
jgi:hypothetical protein